jgi:hypothetical protein
VSGRHVLPGVQGEVMSEEELDALLQRMRDQGLLDQEWFLAY